MRNWIRVALVVVLSLCIAFAFGSLAMAQGTKQKTDTQSTKEDTDTGSAQKETAAPGTQEKTAAPSATQNKKSKAGNKGDKYQKNFPPEPFKNTGSNPHFILEPGYVLKLEGIDEGQQVLLTITVTDEIEVVDGVETRVVEERESKDGTLFEISRNFFVLGQQTNTAYYFGEDAQFFDGRPNPTEGSWRSGVDGAKYGQQMPAKAREGQRYFQEVAPGVALDRAEHLTLKADVKTPAGDFRNVLKVRETTPLEPKVEEFKFHAEGVGLIKDGPLKLTCSGSGSTCAT